MVGGKELVVHKHKLVIGIVIHEVVYSGNALVHKQVVNLEIVGVFVTKLSLEQEKVEAHGPLLNWLLQVELSQFHPLFVPNLHQVLSLAVQVLDLWSHPELDGSEVHCL